MSLDEYLARNFDASLLKKLHEHQQSPQFKAMKQRTSSARFQAAKRELKRRDRIVHKDTLVMIRKLQDEIISN